MVSYIKGGRGGDIDGRTRGSYILRQNVTTKTFFSPFFSSSSIPFEFTFPQFKQWTAMTVSTAVWAWCSSQDKKWRQLQQLRRRRQLHPRQRASTLQQLLSEEEGALLGLLSSKDSPTQPLSRTRSRTRKCSCFQVRLPSSKNDGS